MTAVLSVLMLSLFAVIFVVPMVEDWPYKTGFSLEHVQTVFADSELLTVYRSSLFLALATALLGTLAAYGGALITARSTLARGYKRTVESIALVTNAIPGMVLGVAYLFLFSGTGLQNTLLLMILCNVVHYFSTPYLMMKNSLSKMNAGVGDHRDAHGGQLDQDHSAGSHPQRPVQPHRGIQLLFYQLHGDHQRLIFIAGARTMVLTTKIKQLQYVNKFNEVFVLSLLILATNLVAKAVFSRLANQKRRSRPNRHKLKKKRRETKMHLKKLMAMGLSLSMAAALLGGCAAGSASTGSDCSGDAAPKEEQVVLYSNADDEAITAMTNARDANGYKDTSSRPLAPPSWAES